MGLIRRLWARWQHDNRMRELIKSCTPEYDHHSDAWYLSPGMPINEEHIRIIKSDPWLTVHWPPYLRAEYGLLTLEQMQRDYEKWQDEVW
ncbi:MULTISPECIES: hypothetical protein [Haematobacter]|uniref:Uncharacterized protein n=1 Tax=Haematobacter massiliensis TaxID=195105 RepID=A0A086Y8U4_9RHOB|nr:MULTISPECIES: hypothetical protein [Haematobacter]KFI30694.1 hypothetical protein CN97_12835 [Haematobacter massiliensis]OWJ70915.1 hypothetical protein CDV50_11310 [Haematobacter massiliensis]OWJ87456.1 hypothetical protein CDV51_06930 [Haematobacter massiliensis]QBJ24909.1 hypothetical protein HmaOT1_12035 [Haematobacter massiliensis]